MMETFHCIRMKKNVPVDVMQWLVKMWPQSIHAMDNLLGYIPLTYAKKRGASIGTVSWLEGEVQCSSSHHRNV